MRIIGQAPVKHSCYGELPKRKHFWNRFPEGVVRGTIAECSCGKRYVYNYDGYVESWCWNEYKGGAIFY